jgi:hypothetical protein
MRHIPVLALFLAAGLLLAQTGAPVASETEAIYRAAAQSAKHKFDHIVQNASSSHPSQTPTVLTENELNAWLASGNARLPQGVKKFQVHGTPGIINATAFVDFDQVTAGRNSGNPLLSLFRGTHEVEASAHAQGAGGQGQVHIDSVSLDGVAVPRMALEFFVDRYIKPKHPNLGLDSTFELPYRIDIATVGSRQMTITQK